ncbi:hypothetical protein AUJ84_04200 [Candidatus Pacearchaeota archaeon CG1_02_32_132]|nr:MAG: hypothetical protein AUJ84_04200 [Candidatus Pacearchaeota archaeon CG1_02_32_132]
MDEEVRLLRYNKIPKPREAPNPWGYKVNKVDNKGIVVAAIPEEFSYFLFRGEYANKQVIKDSIKFLDFAHINNPKELMILFMRKLIEYL